MLNTPKSRLMVLRDIHSDIKESNKIAIHRLFEKNSRENLRALLWLKFKNYGCARMCFLFCAFVSFLTQKLFLETRSIESIQTIKIITSNIDHRKL